MFHSSVCISHALCMASLKSQVVIYSKQPNLELTQEFGPTAFSVSSERHGRSGVNEIAQASKRRRWNRTIVLSIDRRVRDWPRAVSGSVAPPVGQDIY